MVGLDSGRHAPRHTPWGRQPTLFPLSWEREGFRRRCFMNRSAGIARILSSAKFPIANMLSYQRSPVLRRIGAGALLAAGLIAGPACAQKQQILDNCTGKEAGSRDQQIINCTEVIETHGLAGKQLAAAYNNRGTAHYARREFDLAIADYTAAIELDSRSARAYGNRALAHKALNVKERHPVGAPTVRKAPEFYT